MTPIMFAWSGRKTVKFVDAEWNLVYFQLCPMAPLPQISHELQEDRSPVSSFMCLMTGLPLLEANDDLASLRLAPSQLQGSCAL